MQLFLNEQRPGRRSSSCSTSSTTLTREPFAAAKGEIDTKLAAELRHRRRRAAALALSRSVLPGIAGDLRRQSRLASSPTADILALCRKFYAGIGLPIDDVIARSDLYEKPGKSPHAFCTDIDREGDVRVLANIVPNEYWMGTMLHELGHSVYSSKNIPPSVPYVLRTDAHILTTEGRGHDVRAVLQERRLAGEDGRDACPTRRPTTRPARRCAAISC